MGNKDLKIFYVGRLSLFADIHPDEICAGWFTCDVFSSKCASCGVGLGKGLSLREQYLNLGAQMCCTCFLYINNSLLGEVNETDRLIQLTNQLISVWEWAESFFRTLRLVMTSVIQLLTCRHPAPFKVLLAEICTRLAGITWDLWKPHLFRLATESQTVCPKSSWRTLDTSV